MHLVIPRRLFCLSFSCLFLAACTHRAVVAGEERQDGEAPDVSWPPDRAVIPDWPAPPDWPWLPDGPLPDLVTPPDAKQPNKCAPGTKLVYVVDGNRKLYIFSPGSKNFSYLGILNCPVSGSPYSMAVRHDGTAIVLYAHYNSANDYTCDGLGKLDVKTLKCTKVASFSCSTTSYSSFGMGYVVTGASGAEELFIGTAGKTLAILDPAAGKMTKIGSLPSAAPEFAGNAGGELWGFFPRVAPATVCRIDPKTGQVLVTHSLSPFVQPWAGSYAFAMYNNVFYIFYGYNSSTNVYRLTKSGQLTLYIKNTGLNIVGAGVSTCAN